MTRLLDEAIMLHALKEALKTYQIDFPDDLVKQQMIVRHVTNALRAKVGSRKSGQSEPTIPGLNEALTAIFREHGPLLDEDYNKFVHSEHPHVRINSDPAKSLVHVKRHLSRGAWKKLVDNTYMKRTTKRPKPRLVG